MSESRLKFRAWDTSNNNFGMSEPFNIGDDPMFLLSDGDGYVLQGLKNCTVMQYTGLKDKNDTEIYEGDIFKMWDLYFAVIWRTLTAGFEIRDVLQVDEFYKVHDQIEIIGNVHSHPELLEVK